MISLELWLHVFIFLIAKSRGSPSTDQNNVPSQIVMNENFRDPILIPSALSSDPPPIVTNFLHQGTNFFFYPQLLLGTFVSPQNGASVSSVKENITEAPRIIEEPVLFGNTESTPIHAPPIVIDEVIVVQPPFPPPILINEPIIPPLPSSPPLIPLETPVIPENIIVKEIPPAPILPPLELSKITKIIEKPVEIFPPCNETEVIVPKLVSIHALELGLRILEKDIIHNVPKQSTMKFIQIPATLELPSSVMPDFTKFLDKGETVVLIPPVPEIPTLLNPSFLNEPVFSERTVDLPIQTTCARHIVVERILPNIVISKKTFSKSVELIAIPTAESPVLTASAFPNIMSKLKFVNVK